MNDKAKWALLTILLLAGLGGGLYYVFAKKYYPAIEKLAYLTLDLTSEPTQLKAGVQVQNRIPLSIDIDSIRYTVKEQDFLIGWGQMVTAHTLPPLGQEVLDFSMQLQQEKYRQRLKNNPGKDSMRLDVKADVFFDLPLLSPTSISVNRQLTVAVPKGPGLQVKDVVVRQFSVAEGYSFLIQLDASNQDLPDVQIKDFAYSIKLDDSLTLTGQVDTAFQLQKENKLLEIPVVLKTTDAIALIKKVLAGQAQWKYLAKVEAQVQSSHRLFQEVKVLVEKDGSLALGNLGAKGSYLPTLSKIKKLEVDSDEDFTLLRAAVVVHNPAPLPFYIDSVSYFIRHQGRNIASGKKDYEKVLKQSADQELDLRLLLDESAYEAFMQDVQGQENVNLDVALNLLYHLPNAQKQSIQLNKQVQVPVPGQGSLKVKNLVLQEISPAKGASLTLTLEVQSTNLPALSIHELNYKLRLGQDLTISGQTQKPIQVSGSQNLLEIPLHLSAEDVNQLLNKALKGSLDWNYTLEASAEIRSANKIIGPTKLDLEFTGELEMTKGMSGTQYVPHITKIDTLHAVIQYDTAWVRLHIQVKNPLPVAFTVDSLLLTVNQGNQVFGTVTEKIEKVLPAEGTQSAWVTLKVNYGPWKKFLYDRQKQDSLYLEQTVTLVYQVENLAPQRTSFSGALTLPTPAAPVTELLKVRPKGISLTKGILVSGLVLVKNRNLQNLEITNPIYQARVEGLLAVCGTINRTYQVGQGDDTVSVPMNLSIGEVFRALVMKFTGKGKSKDIFLNATATVSTNDPKLQNTHVIVEISKKEVLFPPKKEMKSKGVAADATVSANYLR